MLVLSESGDRVAVSYPTADIKLNNKNYNQAGVVQIYELNNNEQWIKIGNDITGDLVSDNGSINARIGYYPNTIDINHSGNVVAVAGSNIINNENYVDADILILSPAVESVVYKSYNIVIPRRRVTM